MHTINSFDCARQSMGVVTVTMQHTVVPAPADHTVAALELHLEQISRALDDIIRICHVDVWNLGEGAQAWQVAVPLRARLQELAQPSILVYEFQMSINDKSRMISNMLAYHYSGTATLRVAPALKNLVVMARNVSMSEFAKRCPITSKKKIKHRGRMLQLQHAVFETRATVALEIQTFLMVCGETYKANKLHAAACMEWWCSVFAVDLSRVPAACLDDAADAFIQLLGSMPAILRL